MFQSFQQKKKPVAYKIEQTVDTDGVISNHDATKPLPKKKKKVVKATPAPEPKPVAKKTTKKRVKGIDVSSKDLRMAMKALPAPKNHVPALRAPSSDNVDESTVKVLQSTFGPKADHIVAMLDSPDSDGAVSLLARTLLQTLIGVIPFAEHNVRQTQGAKGIYQLSQIISSTREMLAELQALKDKGMIGESIVDRYVRPSYTDLATQITLMFTTINETAKQKMSREDYKAFEAETLSLKQNIARLFTAQYGEVRAGIVSALN